MRQIGCFFEADELERENVRLRYAALLLLVFVLGAVIAITGSILSCCCIVILLLSCRAMLKHSHVWKTRRVRRA